MESEEIRNFIKKTIQEGDLGEIKELFTRNYFELLDQKHFIDLWEDKTICLLEFLLIINRQHDFYNFDGYHIPERFKDYISGNIRKKIIDLFEKLEKNDFETLVWLDYADCLIKEDFSKFSEQSIMKFIEKYYYTVIISEKYPIRVSWIKIRAFEKKVGKSLSKPVKKLIMTLNENNDVDKFFMVEKYNWLNLLSKKDLYGLLGNQNLNIFEKICKSNQKKRYEYHGFGDNLDKDIFNFFQKTLPRLEAKALLDLQNIISIQLIIDHGYHEEIFHAYRIKSNHVDKLWLPGIKLLYLPESIGNMQFLKTLNLSGCGLNFLPISIGNLKNLKTLDIRGCNLSSLPESFEKLQNLEKLYIRGNCFDLVPRGIGKLKSLKYFDVIDEDLIDYPPFR